MGATTPRTRPMEFTRYPARRLDGPRGVTWSGASQTQGGPQIPLVAGWALTSGPTGHQMLGRKTTRTPKEYLTGFLMAKRSRAGFPTPARQVNVVRTRTVLGRGLYVFVVGDGQARWPKKGTVSERGFGWVARLRRRRLTGPTWLGPAALAGKVCCHWSPGSGRLLPLGTSPASGREEWRPIMAPGSGLKITILSY